MKKYFVVSDVHGFYDELKKALDEKGFDINNENHIFVSCGDLLDRGQQPKECLEFVNSLPDDRKILIRGNHEDLIEQAIDRDCFEMHDWSNGTVLTACILTDDTNMLNQSNILAKLFVNKDFNKYMLSLVDYYETDHYIFVHGWIPTFASGRYTEDWRESSELSWADARWYNGMDCWYAGVVEPGKTIVCGHWHSSYGNYLFHQKGSGEFKDDSDFSPFVDKGIMAIDACTAFSKKVNCVVIDD